ncbi:hypothetical protein BCD48_34805 [Pseudofrankia sp. BMG5.36]|nr:hypothetical protein BCD48_34805 [Pseudofrankia sp. BMG5.36]
MTGAHELNVEFIMGGLSGVALAISLRDVLSIWLRIARSSDDRVDAGSPGQEERLDLENPAQAERFIMDFVRRRSAAMKRGAE